jgi:DNA-directed RNA polymerase specialized sigma24 family protein
LGGGSAGGRVRHPCVSTRYAQPRPVSWLPDPAEQVALVARAKRAGLLRAHRRRLRREDLEDCLSQAVLELVAGARGGQRFSSRTHLENALEQRFLSRVQDRRRALGGRSPLQAALEGALPLGGPREREVEVVDPRAEIHPLVMRRLELLRVQKLAPRLSSDQRLVLACQVALGMNRAEFCSKFGWSFEKYRKVAQRARARLRVLIEAEPWEVKAEPCEVEAGPCEVEAGPWEVKAGPCEVEAGPCDRVNRGSSVPLRGRSRNRGIGTHL